MHRDAADLLGAVCGALTAGSPVMLRAPRCSGSAGRSVWRIDCGISSLQTTRRHTLDLRLQVVAVVDVEVDQLRSANLRVLSTHTHAHTHTADWH